MRLREKCSRCARRVGVALAIGVALFCGSLARAEMVSAVGVAEAVTDAGSPFFGWYKYTYTIEWDDLQFGLSHPDIVLKEGCASPDHLFGFDVADLGAASDGVSTGEDWDESGPDPEDFVVLFVGTFEPVEDPSIPLAGPLVKWDQIEDQDDEPGKTGVGVFCFYANIIPESGTFEDKVAVKYGPLSLAGDITGDYPSCTIIPEPATLGLFSLGAVGMAVLGWRRRR